MSPASGRLAETQQLTLAPANDELAEALHLIQAMQSSPFWRLRRTMIGVLNRLGLRKRTAAVELPRIEGATLAQAHGVLAAALHQIEAMQSSPFWRLRRITIGILNHLGLRKKKAAIKPLRTRPTAAAHGPSQPPASACPERQAATSDSPTHQPSTTGSSKPQQSRQRPRWEQIAIVPKTRRLIEGIKAMCELRTHYDNFQRLDANVEELGTQLLQLERALVASFDEIKSGGEKGRVDVVASLDEIKSAGVRALATELLVDELAKLDLKAVDDKSARAIRRFALLQESYSQEGEDLVLAQIFEGKPPGFYVDVGAHHPIRYSNTYLFYRRGWRGINIEAMPGSMEEFRRVRPHDTNIEALVSLDRGSVPFFVFNESALNTTSVKLAKQWPKSKRGL